MTEQTTRPIGSLALGEHLYRPLRGSDDVCGVRHVHTWHGTTGRMEAAVTVVSLSTHAAELLFGPADQEVALATAEQVRDAVEAGVRNRAVAQLREIAGLIERHQVRIVEAWGAPEVRLEVADGEVDRVAQLLGVAATDHALRRRVVWPGPDRSVTVSAEFVGMPASTPAPQGGETR